MKKLLLLLCCLTAATAAYPQAPWFVQRFKVTGGYFLALNTTDVKVTNNELLGTKVNLEDDLGFSNQVHTFLANAQWRATSRARFDFSYYRLHRSATHQLDRTIQFGENTYQVNGQTDAYFNADIFRGSFGYAIFQGSRYEAGLMIGAHVVKTNMGIALTGAGDGLDIKDDYDVTAPMPDAGIWGGFAFAPRWALNAEASYMALKVDDINGNIFSGSVQVNYQVIPSLSAAVGYNMLHLDVDGKRNGLLGDVAWKYNGPSVSVSYSFGKKRW
ncbi:hypothetical protein MKQ70_03600 [Chitinophaga sedimenti]|uniref:hypothetical protein n=1 Tax=Chitinophaga sedimenti TaxID=2033606 RepID=UPI0020063774|nr:hypothetical protein [Chitinophaga sedimenti]MCK7554141.1 hypothetical protein [Chitinophaga sedimenti]